MVSIILYPDIVSSFGVETSNCCTFCDDTDVADKFIPDWLFTDSLFDSIFTAVFDSIFTLFTEVSDSIFTVFIGTLSTVLTSSVTFDLFPRNPISVGSYVILLANFGRSKNLVFIEGLGCIEIKKNVFQFFFSILCILQTRFKIIPFLRYSSHDKWVINVTAFQCYSCVGHKTLRRNFDVVLTSERRRVSAAL